jgi:phage-related minor tail protein
MAEQAYEQSHLKLLQMFMGVGRGASVTAADVEALAEANARLGKGSVGASEEYAQALLHINGMTRENLGAAISIVEDFAKATGQDGKQALAELTKALSDPRSGIVDLNRELSAFTQEEIRSIQTMIDHGDKAGAMKVMLDRVKIATGGAAEELNGLGKALKFVAEKFSEAWRSAGKFFFEITHGATADDLPDLKAKLAAYKADKSPTARPLQAMLEANIARIEKQQSQGNGAGANAAAAQNKANQDYADQNEFSLGRSARRRKLMASIANMEASLKPGGDLKGQTREITLEQLKDAKRDLQDLNGGKPKAGPADTTLQFDKEATSTLNRAITDRAQAEAALTQDVQERARLEKIAINDAYDKQRADIEAQRAKIGEAKGDKNKAAQLAALERADAEIAAAQNAKEIAVDKALARKLEDNALALATRVAEANTKLLTAQLAQAKTREERSKLEHDVLDSEKAAFDTKLAEERKKAIEADPAHAGQIGAGFDVLQQLGDKTFDSRSKAIDGSHKSPWQIWAEEARDASHSVHDSIQSYAIKGLDEFNNGLVDAIVNGKDLGATMKNILREMEADLIRYLIKQAELNAFGDGTKGSSGFASNFVSSALNLFKLPGFASGTNSAPGGLSWVGEHGPELMNVPKGAQIIPNNLIGSFGRSMPQASNRVTYIGGPTFQLHSPVVTTDLLEQMHSISAQNARQAAAFAVNQSQKGQGAWSNADYMLRR